MQTVCEGGCLLLLLLQFLNGDVVAGDALKVLEGLGDEAFVTERKGDGLVLGFSSPTGASSMADIPLGDVRIRPCSSRSAAGMQLEEGTFTACLNRSRPHVLLLLIGAGHFHRSSQLELAKFAASSRSEQATIAA